MSPSFQTVPLTVTNTKATKDARTVFKEYRILHIFVIFPQLVYSIPDVPFARFLS